MKKHQTFMGVNTKKLNTNLAEFPSLNKYVAKKL